MLKELPEPSELENPARADAICSIPYRTRYYKNGAAVFVADGKLLLKGHLGGGW